MANHGVWIKCIFEQLDRISNVVAWGGYLVQTCPSQNEYFTRNEKFLLAEMMPNLRQKLRAVNKIYQFCSMLPPVFDVTHFYGTFRLVSERSLFFHFFMQLCICIPRPINK
jgi:hypothetical protein